MTHIGAGCQYCFLSAHTDADVEPVFAAGADDYVNKPIGQN